MRLVFSLRLLSPYLGARFIGPKAPLALPVDPRNPSLLLLDIPMWNWAWAEAFQDEAPDIYRASIRMDRVTPCPAVTLYARRISKGGTCMHESISRRAVITMGASIVRPDPTENSTQRSLRMPVAEEIHRALTRIGDTLGISPFGARFGYGRFEITAFEIDGRSYPAPVKRAQPDRDTGVVGDEGPAEMRGEETGKGREPALGDEGSKDLP